MMNVVYAMTRNVYEWIIPSLKSLAEHCSDVNVTILAEDDDLGLQLPVPVRVINVSDQSYFPKDGMNYDNAFTYINLLKVRYPSILNEMDKVIHLDIDTIICDELTELWNTDLTGKWFGAVNESRGWYKPFGRKYYNLGVAVINLKQMREDGIEQIMQDYLNTVKQPWADQDAWNKYGIEQKKIAEVNLRYNESQMTGFTDDPAVIHFCGIKDWYTSKSMYRREYLNKYKADGNKMKILIAVPTYENIYPDTFKSIYQLDKGDHEVDFDFVRGYDVANARNAIGRMLKDSDYDYVLMVDNDEVLPKDALLNLLESEQSYKLKHTMSVGYCLSRPSCAANTNGRTTAFKFGGKDYVAEDAYTGAELQKLKEEGQYQIQIRGSGLGCALIHRSVFEKLKYPYFKWLTYHNNTQLSEDLFFCERFKEINAPILVDTRVACGHMMRHIDYIK